MSGPAAQLERRLGLWDGIMLTVGAIVGTGIFMTPSEMARTLPHTGLLVLVWALAGLVIVAGAFAYAELGAMFPRAGGVYHFLHEAYGPLVGFLYGWTCFLVIMSGGIAAIASGFGHYVVSFVPVPGGAQTAAVGAIVLLTGVNTFGVQQGAWVQNALTVLKIASLAAFILVGWYLPAAAPVTWTDAFPSVGLASAFGVAMIAALWAYDGWYAMTFSAGELEDPSRSLPRGMVGGVAATVLIYAAAMAVYARVLPVDAIASAPRVAETAAAALLGDGAGRLMSAAIAVSAFGCLSATIFYSSRVYAPMAEAGLFFRSLAAIHPRYHTPVRSLWHRAPGHACWCSPARMRVSIPT